MQPRHPAPRQREIRLTGPTDGLAEGLTCPAVSPRVIERMPQLLRVLTSHTEDRIQQHTTYTDLSRVRARRLTGLLPGWTELDDPRDDAVAEAVDCIRGITARALTYGEVVVADLSSYHQRRHTALTETVTSIGTGRGPLNANLGALARGLVTLHGTLDGRPRVLTLQMDDTAWTDLDDRRTIIITRTPGNGSETGVQPGTGQAGDER